jgi:hypothetical protein
VEAEYGGLWGDCHIGFFVLAGGRSLMHGWMDACACTFDLHSSGELGAIKLELDGMI